MNLKQEQGSISAIRKKLLVSSYCGQLVITVTNTIATMTQFNPKFGKENTKPKQELNSVPIVSDQAVNVTINHSTQQLPTSDNSYFQANYDPYSLTVTHVKMMLLFMAKWRKKQRLYIASDQMVGLYIQPVPTIDAFLIS